MDLVLILNLAAFFALFFAVVYYPVIYRNLKENHREAWLQNGGEDIAGGMFPYVLRGAGKFVYFLVSDDSKEYLGKRSVYFNRALLLLILVGLALPKSEF